MQLSVNLRTIRRLWQSDSISLRAQCVHAAGAWTHELFIGDKHDSVQRGALFAPILELGDTCWHFRIEDNSMLKADCLLSDASTGFRPKNREIQDMSELPRRQSQRFFWIQPRFIACRRTNFSHSARNIRLHNASLCADLKNKSGTWVASEIPLNRIVIIHDGLQLANGKTILVNAATQLSARLPGLGTSHDLVAAGAVGQTLASAALLYAPLDDDAGEFRILYIEPGRSNDPIQCKMCTWRPENG